MLEAGVGLCNFLYLNHLLEFVSTSEFVSIYKSAEENSFIIRGT